MPSIVHSSPSLTGLPGLALVSHDFSEQADGLVTASCEFVCRATRQFELDRLFSIDAAPPVALPGINNSHLLYNRMFMSGRTISQANGLTHIKAEYVGGLVRGGEYMVFYKEAESPVSFNFVSEPFSITRQNPSNPTQISTISNVTTSIRFTYLPIVFVYEYVAVGDQKTAQPAAPGKRAVYTLISFDGIDVVFSNDSWSTVGFIQRRENYYREIIERKSIVESISESVITNLVRKVTHRFFLGE